MNPDQFGFTLLLVAVLLGLSGYFGKQQIKTLRGLGPLNVLGADDRSYLRSQAYRRLFCSFVMVVMAGLLVAWLFVDADQNELEKMSREASAHTFGTYTAALLFLLLLLLVLATMDFWATARYGLRQHRKLLADRRTLLEEQAKRMRQERNGQRGA